MKYLQLAGKDVRCHLFFTKNSANRIEAGPGVQTFSNPTHGLGSLGSIVVV